MGWGLGEHGAWPLAEGLCGGVAVQGLLPLRPAPETMAWLHSISRHPRAAVSSVQRSPGCLLWRCPFCTPSSARTGQAGLAGWGPRDPWHRAPRPSWGPQALFLSFRAPNAKAPCVPPLCPALCWVSSCGVVALRMPGDRWCQSSPFYS